MKKSIVISNNVIKDYVSMKYAADSLKYWKNELNNNPDSVLAINRIEFYQSKINDQNNKIIKILDKLENELNIIQNKSKVRIISAENILDSLIKVKELINRGKNDWY